MTVPLSSALSLFCLITSGLLHLLRDYKQRKTLFYCVLDYQKVMHYAFNFFLLVKELLTSIRISCPVVIVIIA